MGSLAKVHDQIGNKGVSCSLELCLLSKAKGISIDEIIEYVTIYGNDLPMVKRQYDDVNGGLKALLQQIYQCEKEFEYMNSKIEKLADDLRSKQIECGKAERKRNDLLSQKMQLLRFISDFKHNNRIYIKIGRFVEERVNMILKDNMKLPQVEFG